MSRITLAVLFGGRSTEYEVSLQSAHAVLSHLDPSKYQPVPLGITREGRWLLYGGPLDALLDDTWSRGPCTPAVLSPDRETHGLLVLDSSGPVSMRLDAAFPVLHGKNGEDGTVQGLLELSGVPVVGCGVLSSALCMDKDLAHQVAAAAGIPVPASALFRAGEAFKVLEGRCAHLGWPRFVKPANAGSSFGVSRVTGPAQLVPAVTAALEHDGKVVLEEAVPGFEVGCAVLGSGEALRFGRPDEIELAGGFFDYTEKYNLITAQIHTPARVDPGTEARILDLAGRVYRALGCSGFARVDLFLTPEGSLIFNEVNTIPGFTGHSRYPAMMAAAGVPFSALLDQLIETAVTA